MTKNVHSADDLDHAQPASSQIDTAAARGGESTDQFVRRVLNEDLKQGTVSDEAVRQVVAKIEKSMRSVWKTRK